MTRVVNIPIYSLHLAIPFLDIYPACNTDASFSDITRMDFPKQYIQTVILQLSMAKSTQKLAHFCKAKWKSHKVPYRWSLIPSTNYWFKLQNYHWMRWNTPHPNKKIPTSPCHSDRHIQNHKAWNVHTVFTTKFD